MSTATLNIEKKKKLVPKLRFPEFEGEWKVDELGNNAKVTSGGTPSRNKNNFWNGNIPWITTSLINFNVINTAEEFITQDAVLKSSAKLFPKGTILMAMYGQGKTRGKVAVLGLDATTNQACGAILPNDDLDKNYLFQNFAGRYDEIRDLSNEGGQQNLSGGIIKGIKISFPTLPEQQKIATFLSAVDEKIHQLSRKKELLEQYKKGVMQQLFSGKLRFKDENGKDYADWEQKKLGEVCDVRDGTHDSPKYVDKGFAFITSKNLMKDGSIDFDNVSFINEIDYNKVNQRSKVNINDILFGMIGTIGNPVLVKSEGFAIKNVALIKEKQELLNFFLIHFLKGDSINQQFFEQNTGGTQKFLSLSVIRNLSVIIPSIQEQQKIANFLSSIDAKIESTSQQITQTQSFKKGLLQQLFV